MLWKRLQDKRGQIRGIDFLISTFFFVIVLGQLIVVILNANIMIVSQQEINTTRNDVDQLAASMFGYEGSPSDWGDLNIDSSDIDSFGLATRELATTGYELDPQKLARLNIDAAGITDPDYSNVLVSYERIQRLLGLNSSQLQFHLRIQSSLSLSVDLGNHEISVNVSFIDLVAIEGVTVSLFAIDFTNGSLFSLVNATTDAAGEVTLNYLSSAPLDYPHALIVVGQKGPLWGVTHLIPDEDSNPLFDISLSDHPLFLSQNGTFSAHVVGSSDFRRSLENHTFSFVYTNSSSTNGFSYRTQAAFSTDPILELEFDANAEGVIIGVACISVSNGVYQYRLGVLPTLLDRSEETDGIFYEIGPSLPDSGIEGVGFNRYSLTVRGMLLIAELTIWEEV